MEPRLEQAEYKLLCMAVTDAVRLAGRGDVAAGYDCLLAGMYRAIEFVDSGASWANELVRSYRSAIGEYSTQYLGRRGKPASPYSDAGGAARCTPWRPRPRATLAPQERWTFSLN